MKKILSGLLITLAIPFSALADQNLPVQSVVLECNTCVTQADYRSVISNHHGRVIVDNMPAKHNTFSQKRWEREYTVINNNREEAAFVSYRYVEINDPESGNFDIFESYKFIYGSSSEAMAKLYPLSLMFFDNISSGEGMATSAGLTLDLLDVTGESLHTFGATNVNRELIMNAFRERFGSEFLPNATNSEIAQLLSDRVVYKVRLVTTSGHVVYMFHSLFKSGEMFPIPDTLVHYPTDELGNPLDPVNVPWPALDGVDLIKVSGGGAGFGTASSGSIVISYSGDNGSGEIKCVKNGRETSCNVTVIDRN